MVAKIEKAVEQSSEFLLPSKLSRAYKRDSNPVKIKISITCTCNYNFKNQMNSDLTNMSLNMFVTWMIFISCFISVLFHFTTNKNKGFSIIQLPYMYWFMLKLKIIVKDKIVSNCPKSTINCHKQSFNSYFNSSSIESKLEFIFWTIVNDDGGLP